MDKENEVNIEKHEVIDNPLLAGQQQQALVISPGQEIEQKVEVINEIESLAEITKQQLSVRRQRIELEVENQKLDTAKKTINNIEKIIDSVSSAEVLKRVTDHIKTPLDLKMMAEAAERLTNALKGLMNSNVLDDMGNKKKQKINFMFKSSGPVQGVIQVENPTND